MFRATMASAATGTVIYLLVMHWVLPAVQTRLTPAQVEWLRQALMDHTVAVLGVILAFAAVLGLPLLMAFRWVYGPMQSGGKKR